jgi:hypothetical protein
LPWWLDGLRELEGGRPPAPVLGAPPAGLEQVRIDRETGLRASHGGLDVWFREGAAPEELAGSPRGGPGGFEQQSREF